MGNGIREIISAHPWLQDLTATMPKRFLASMEVISCPARTKIITKGTENPYIYILIQGNNRVINEFSNGRVFEFSTTSSQNTSGKAFSGLLEFFSGYSTAASTVETAGKSTYIRLRKSVLRQWLEEDPAAFRKIVRIFARQMYPTLNAQGKMVIYSGLYSLVNYLVLNYQESTFRTGSAIIPATREEISQELGISIRTMYRLCADLANRDMISVVKKKICISRRQMKDLITFLDDEEDSIC